MYIPLASLPDQPSSPTQDTRTDHSHPLVHATSSLGVPLADSLCNSTPPCTTPLCPVCSLRATLSLSPLPFPLLVPAPYSRLLFMCSPVISRPLRILLLLLLLLSCRQHHVLLTRPHWPLLSLSRSLSPSLSAASHLLTPPSLYSPLPFLPLRSRTAAVCTGHVRASLGGPPFSPFTCAGPPCPSRLRPSRSDDSVQKSALLVASPLALVPAHCHFWFGACVNFLLGNLGYPGHGNLPSTACQSGVDRSNPRANPEWGVAHSNACQSAPIRIRTQCSRIRTQIVRRESSPRVAPTPLTLSL